MINGRRSALLAFLIPILLACRQPSLDPHPQPTDYLLQSIERIYTPVDSLTVIRKYAPVGQVITESFSSQRGLRPYTLYSFYGPVDQSKFEDNLYLNQYRFHQTNSIKQLIASQHYFPVSYTSWKVYQRDTLLYAQGRLVQQDHRDYAFIADSQKDAFKYSLWLTRRYLSYDDANRVKWQTDSVFATHDMLAGTLVIAHTPDRFLYINQTQFVYNQQGELVKQVHICGADSLPTLRYSNGLTMFSTFGQLSAWSTVSESWPARFRSGVTTYQYSYGADGKVLARQSIFDDATTKRTYTSTYAYHYSSH